MTVYADIGKALKIQRKDDESLLDFSKRVVKKVNALDDAEWKELPPSVQVWSNAVQVASEAATGNDEPEIPETVTDKDSKKSYELGWPGEEASGEDDDQTDDGDESSTGDDAAEENDEEGDEEENEEDEGGGDSEEGGEEESGGDGEKEVDGEAETEEEEVSEEPEPEAKPARAGKKPKAKAKAPAKSPKVKEKSPSKEKAKDMEAKKPKTASKAAAGANARTRIGGNQVIKVLKSEPHRAGTKNAKVFSKYKDGMTVDEALKAKIPQRNIYYEVKCGNIKLVAGKKAAA